MSGWTDRTGTRTTARPACVRAHPSSLCCARGSRAKQSVSAPISQLASATSTKAKRQPSMPKGRRWPKLVPSRLPRRPPTPPVKCNRPKARPRSWAGCRSAISDWAAGMSRARLQETEGEKWTEHASCSARAARPACQRHFVKTRGCSNCCSAQSQLTLCHPLPRKARPAISSWWQQSTCSRRPRWLHQLR